MAIVSIVGNVDKRIIAIPLARALSIDGKTALITDDTSFRRLYKDSSNVGSISGIDIVIDHSLSEKSADCLEDTYENYKNYLYVSDNFIHKSSNCIVVCRGRDRSFLSDDVAKVIGEEGSDGKTVIKSNEIILATGKVDKKETANAMLVTEKHYRYLGEVEETKELVPPNDAVLAKTIAKLVGNDIGMNIGMLEKLINRQQLVTTKEVSGKR